MDQKKVAVRAQKWEAWHSEQLSRAITYEGHSIAPLQKMFEQEAALLIELYQGEQRRGCMLLTVEPTEAGNEGVMLAGAGVGLDLYSFGVETAKQLLSNCIAIRTTTARRGIVRILEKKHGFETVEHTLRIKNG